MTYFYFKFRWIPPYHIYILALLTFMIGQYNITSVVEYSSRIAPPTLVATVIAVNNCAQFVIGN